MIDATSAGHVRWRDPSHRISLVCDELPAVAAAHEVTWSFTDLPGDGVIEDGVIEDGVIEVVFSGEAEARDLFCRVLGLQSRSAVTLNPNLYLYGWVPAALVATQARCTARAIRLISWCRRSGMPGLDDELVAAEIRAVHVALSGSDAAKSLRWQALWLRGPRTAEVVTPARPDDGAASRVLPVPLPPVADHVDARELGSRGEEARTAMVARLAHIQALRLWGPTRRMSATEEADLLVTLASTVGCTRRD
jgi:hypothetical protein